MKTLLIAFFFAFGIGAAGLVEAANAGQRLNGNQIKSLFRGTLTGFYKDKYKLTAKVTRSGQVMAWVDGKVDTGTWKVVGNQVCVAFKVWTKGKDKCRYVERDGAWFRVVKESGKSNIRIRR